MKALVPATALPPSTRDYLESLQRNAPKDVLNLRGSMQHGDEYKYVTATFSVEDYPKGIEIIHITDVQFGHLMYRKIKFYVECERVIFGRSAVSSPLVLGEGTYAFNTRSVDHIKVVFTGRNCRGLE